MAKDNNHSILTVLMLTTASLIISCLLTACSDFGRYEVYHVDGKPCFVKDWKTGNKLPVTEELLSRATGDWTPCDPDLCK